MVEAGIGQTEGEQIFPVDPCPNGFRRLSVAQPLSELQQRDKGQAPGRVGRLVALGVEVGKACVVEHGAELVTQQQAGWMAADGTT